MKNIFTTFLALLFLFTLTCCKSTSTYNIDATSGATKKVQLVNNSEFHNSNYIKLQSGKLTIKGEINDQGNADLSKFNKIEVYVKEAITENGKPMFIGAYRYKGYSLFDILNSKKLAKKNSEIFRPATDVYIIIENDKGESVVFSWSEVFHTNNPNQIIIATEAAPIEPHRKQVSYPMNSKWKIVASNDLLSYRNLENPTTITIASFNRKNYTIVRHMEPLFSSSLDVVVNDNKIFEINEPANKNITKQYTTFYGMGMGYHKNDQFEGYLLSDILIDHINLKDEELIAHGLLCFASADGYRSMFSFSELFNRVDQSGCILALTPDNEGGKYRNFMPTDFYADRSVKALKEIYIFKP